MLVAGCTYYNTIYNAQRLYDDAELLRRSGQDSIARLQYEEVIRRTGEAYRSRPESEWAGEALFLLGRSRLRLGELAAADGAFVAAASEASPPLSDEVLVYRAAVLAESGDGADALALVNRALDSPLEGFALAEAHLIRGRLLLAGGYDDPAWWDLDRAEEAHRDIRVEAGLARLQWAIERRDVERARRSTRRLLSYPEGGASIDTIAALLDSAEERWDAGVAAQLLDPVRASVWDRDPRGRIALKRASLLNAAGDSAAASEQAWAVAEGLGDASVEARAVLAAWYLEQTRDLVDVYSVRPILLPAGGHALVAPLLEAVEALEALTAIGLAGDPLGWFAAGEVARDELGAYFVARGLFLAYVDGAPEEPWAPKALLAALEVTEEEGDRAWLRGRLETHRESPYVLAAFGGPAAGFEALEEELVVRLRDIKSR